MDIKLGNIGVSSLQIANSHSLIVEPIKGFGHVDDAVIVVATRDLTAPERSSLISSLQALPNEELKRKGRTARKKAVLQKLGLTKQDLNALLEVIQDGNDD